MNEVMLTEDGEDRKKQQTNNSKKTDCVIFLNQPSSNF